MSGLGSPADPESFLGYQLAKNSSLPGAGRPCGGCGLPGCLPLLFVLIALLAIARFF